MSDQDLPSPRWSPTTKLVVAFTTVAVIAALLIRFYNLIGPMLLAFMLAYLFQPAASWLDNRTPLTWRWSVSIIYFVLVLVFVSLLTLGGVGLIQQFQNLITLVQTGLAALPKLVDQISHQTYTFGPFVIDPSQYDLNSLLNEAVAFIQPTLGRAGTLLGSLAGSALQLFGWTAFIMLLSYFVLVESGGLRDRILRVEIPRYGEDVKRIGVELGRIWNAFLRGQFIVFLMAVLIYTFILSIFGVRYALGIALLAGLARFIPYIGPFVTWTVLALVAYFQTFKLWDMSPLTYTLVVLAFALVIDQVFDNLVNPRIMGQALRVHPAAILVAAIVAASLLGVMGVVLAAPLLATMKLIGQYTLRKMFDQDPWPENGTPTAAPGPSVMERLRGWLSAVRGWLNSRKR
ncbi:MAG: AI-2E family transporter [Chloroflexota bacterium]